MSEVLPNLTKTILLKGTFEDIGYNELINYYAEYMTPQQRIEFTDTVNRMLEKVIGHTLLLSNGTPSEVMSIFNAGVCEGFDEGFDQGFKQAQASGVEGGESWQ